MEKVYALILNGEAYNCRNMNENNILKENDTLSVLGGQCYLVDNVSVLDTGELVVLVVAATLIDSDDNCSLAIGRTVYVDQQLRIASHDYEYGPFDILSTRNVRMTIKRISIQKLILDIFTNYNDEWKKAHSIQLFNYAYDNCIRTYKQNILDLLDNDIYGKINDPYCMFSIHDRMYVRTDLDYNNNDSLRISAKPVDYYVDDSLVFELINYGAEFVVCPNDTIIYKFNTFYLNGEVIGTLDGFLKFHNLSENDKYIINSDIEFGNNPNLISKYLNKQEFEMETEQATYCI